MQAKEIMQELVGKTYEEVVKALSINIDQGDCCGWADYEVVDMVTDLDATLVKVIELDYSEDHSSRVVVNFVFDLGETKGLILGYELSAGSSSGWSYGAYVSLNYEGREISSASY